MSTFFRALEQAQRDRALQEEARRAQQAGGGAAGSAPHAGSAATPSQPAVTPSAPATPAVPPPAPGVWPGGPHQSAAPTRDVQPDSPHQGAALTTAELAAPLPSAGVPRGQPAEVEAETGDSPDGLDDHLVSLLRPASFQAEPYRGLRYLVEQRHRAGELSVLAVSSAGVGDGKTTTAINLAGALAQAPDARVLLVDADLRRSSVAHMLGLDGMASRGLVDAILDPALALDDVVISRAPFNLDVLPAGREVDAPYEVLKSPRLAELLEAARRRYDHVVLDTAPLVPVPDTRLLGKLVDGFLLVVAAHRTPRRLLGEALNLMDPARLVGLVFNGNDQSMSGYYSSYGYGYGYGYDRGNGASSNGHSRAGWKGLWRRRPGAGRPRRQRDRTQQGEGPVP